MADDEARSEGRSWAPSAGKVLTDAHVTDPLHAPLRVLLRHADAGVRAEWGAADDWRVLSPLGRRQADGIVARVSGLPLRRVLSSPSLRCRQTVVPLAQYLGLDIEPCRELAADIPAPELLGFLADPGTEAAVLCTHRETLEALFTELALGRTRVPWSDATMEKAAAWLVRGAMDYRMGMDLQYLPAQDLAPTGPRQGQVVAVLAGQDAARSRADEGSQLRRSPT